MNAGAIELLDLVARWVHVIAGIMWVGNSLLFNWLDRSLSHPERSEGSAPEGARRRQPDPSAVGHIWLLHSGGFYFVEKTLLPGQSLPAPLHWFKWQAYTTWLSGLALLIVVYWAGGRAVLADPSVRVMGQGHAVAFSAGLVFLGWLTYELSNRFLAPRAPAVAAIVWITGLIAISLDLLHHLDGRAAFLHIGAMLGTIMAGNVFFTIVPSQHELVASVAAGRDASAATVSARAKRVSIHNNYFTFPVIALMVSNHFPGIYGSRYSGLMLAIIIVGGAAVRHVLNVRFTLAAWRPILTAMIVATVGLLYAIPRMTTAVVAPEATSAAPVTFADARHVIDRRCGACHSVHQSDATFGPAPAGVLFDTPEQIMARAGRINERAVVLKTMPLNNKTGITEAERAILGRWFAQGAVGPP